jgi:Ca-activated chloride channel family protein
MKFAALIILSVALGAFGQSGRVKPTESPTPRSTDRQRGSYVPTSERPRVTDGETEPTPRPPKKEEDDVITVDSVLVPIPVSVLAANGQPVRNLRLTDFLLTIDGKPAEIGELSRSETPIRLAMLFDNSGSVIIAREFEKRAAIKFFRSVLRPEKDMAALFSVATVTRLEQRLTSDVASLTQAIEFFPAPDGATALLDGIDMAARYLGEFQGRRVIVIVSDGDDTKTDTTFDDAVRIAQTFNCQIYVVKTTDFENYIRTRSRRGNANIRQLAAERRMMELAQQTGGSVYSPIDERELDDAFRQISAELSEQYILSYYPDEDRGMTGSFREIGVNVKGQTNLTIRTRKGYYVPKR